MVGVGAALHLLNPCSRSGHIVEVEEVCIENPVEIHIAIVAFNDFRLRLQGAYDLACAAQFLGRHLGGLVEQHDVAELDLLHHQVLDVFVVDTRTDEELSGIELVAHAQSVDNGDDTVESRHHVEAFGHSGY